ncbi:MAG: thermonuclease family protein [Phycisphaeraceae bacterium]
MSPPRLDPRDLARRLRRRRRLIWLAAAMALALLVYADHRCYLLYEGDDWARYDRRSFVVSRVVDGRRLVIAAADGDDATTAVRLWGIEPPPEGPPEAPPEIPPEVSPHGSPRFPQAVDRPMHWRWPAETVTLVRELAEDKTVRLALPARVTRSAKTGELLACVYLPDGSCLNERLLAAGLAVTKVPETTGRPDPFAERFALIQRQAQNDRVGTWRRAAVADRWD